MGTHPGQKGPEHVFRRLWNVILLGLGWCLTMSCLFVNISTTTMAATDWTGDPSFATLPIGAQLLCAALCVLPLGKLAQSYGRRPVFIGAAVCSSMGSAVMVAAAYKQIYGLLLVGAFFQGPSFAVANSFRFVSAEFFTGPGIPPEWRARAISLTVGMAVFAAGIGPESVRHVRSSLSAEYAGCYVLVLGLYLGQALVTGSVQFGWLNKLKSLPHLTIIAASAREEQGLDNSSTSLSDSKQVDISDTKGVISSNSMPPPSPHPPSSPPLLSALGSPHFWAPALSGAIAFCTMAALMVAAPVSMQLDGYSYAQSTFAVEGHIGGMYLPAVFVGDLIMVLRTLALLLPPFLTPFLLLLPGFGPWRVKGESAREFVEEGHTGQESEGEKVTCKHLTPRTWSHAPSIAPTTTVMVWGAGVFLSADIVMMAGRSLGFYMVGIVLIAIGWAMVYVGASSLVAAVIARNPHLALALSGGMDVMVIFLAAVANATGGPLVRSMGWDNFVLLNLVTNAGLTALCLGYHLFATYQHGVRVRTSRVDN